MFENNNVILYRYLKLQLLFFKAAYYGKAREFDFMIYEKMSRKSKHLCQ